MLYVVHVNTWSVNGVWFLWVLLGSFGGGRLGLYNFLLLGVLLETIQPLKGKHGSFKGSPRWPSMEYGADFMYG